MNTHICYQIKPLQSIEQVREVFKLDSPDAFTWLFVGTGGVHGSHDSLDAAMLALNSGRKPRVTVLVVHAKEVCTRYGSIEIETADDVDFLRHCVGFSLSRIEDTQARHLAQFVRSDEDTQIDVSGTSPQG